LRTDFQGCVCLLAFLAAMGFPWAAESATDIDVGISAPADGFIVSGPIPQVVVQGRTRAHHDYPAPRHDVMLIIDISGSTAGPAGGDINGNGTTGQIITGPLVFGRGGRFMTDMGDSILAAEVAAGERLLTRLDPRTTRVAVITFSGPIGEALFGLHLHKGRPNATLQQALTQDFGAVRAALHRILEAGPGGGTDMAAGIRLAVRELAGLGGHVSEPDTSSRKTAILLTDGFPTLPFGGGDDGDHRDVEVAINAARVAAKAGIVIHTFGLGQEALSAPEASMQIAQVTGGRYTPIQTPGNVVQIIEKTSFSDVDLVTLNNLTTGSPARNLSVTADGLFTGEVPLAPGPNQIGVNVLATDGTTATVAIMVHYRPNSSLELDLSKKNHELDLQLQELRERTQGLELQLKQRQEDAAVRAKEAERQRQLELDIQRREPAPSMK
jgi:von Willebrand factor type A domain-containing protein